MATIKERAELAGQIRRNRFVHEQQRICRQDFPREKVEKAIKLLDFFTEILKCFALSKKSC